MRISSHKVRPQWAVAFIIACGVSCVWCEMRGPGEEPRPMNNELEKDILDKTVDLIQKRAYYYGSSGPGKRLPNYDFGLGKRSKPNYNFGLGKRADNSEEESEDYTYDVMPMGFGYFDDPYENIKRSKPYRFGLGKRNGKDQPQQRRSAASRYNFGLGKR